MSRTPEMVVMVGAEGGSLTLARVRSTTGDWQFLVTEDEGTLLDLLSDEDRAKFGDGLSEWGPVATWQEALVLLDRWQWTLFRPLVVHRDYRAAVWAAVQDRQGGHDQFPEVLRARCMDLWRGLCFPEETSHEMPDA